MLFWFFSGSSHSQPHGTGSSRRRSWLWDLKSFLLALRGEETVKHGLGKRPNLNKAPSQSLCGRYWAFWGRLKTPMERALLKHGVTWYYLGAVGRIGVHWSGGSYGASSSQLGPQMTLLGDRVSQNLSSLLSRNDQVSDDAAQWSIAAFCLIRKPEMLFMAAWCSHP